MAGPERSASNNSDLSLPNFRAFPDLIPGIGALTYISRSSKASGESRKETLTNTLGPENVRSFGTGNWQEPRNWRDYLRQTTISARNVGFAFYHTGVPYLGYLALMRFT